MKLQRGLITVLAFLFCLPHHTFLLEKCTRHKINSAWSSFFKGPENLFSQSQAPYSEQ